MVAEEGTPMSNPLPPPPRPPRSSNRDKDRDRDRESVRAENLSNDDFRRMVMETPRRTDDRSRSRTKHDDAENEKRINTPTPKRYRPKPKEEEKKDEPDEPKYRDRAKERREDQNPDYDHTAAELGSLHAVAPPGTVDLRTTDAHRISIENSKFLGGDVEHTHLVKGLDFALLHKVRSEIDRRPEDDDDAEDVKRKARQEENAMVFRTSSAKMVYQWLVKPQSFNKTNEMFLPGRTAFVYNLEEEFAPDIPTTLHRSKADCPVPQEMVTVSVDGTVLERIAKIMTYLRLGSSGKVLKKKKKENGVKGLLPHENGGQEKKHENNAASKQPDLTNLLPLPPPLPKKISAPRVDDDDIFEGAGVDYVPTINDNANESPISEDMEESPREGPRPTSYFAEPDYGPVPPPDTTQEWAQSAGYDAMQGPLLPSSYQREWQEYPPPPPETYAGPWLPDQVPYSEQYMSAQVTDLMTQAAAVGGLPIQDPRFMTQEEKDRGFGSVFKRDDQRLQQRREMDIREKDPNFISASYSECYPGYQEYNREVVDSDDDEDLTKMDMGGRAKGRLHRWDFETEEDWAKYNEQKEAMPKAAFQFGVKMQDGRKTRKQNKDQKLNNELHKINQIMDKKKKEKPGSYDEPSHFDEEIQPGKRLRV